MTLAEFWPLCLCRLHEMLPAGQFAQWIAPLTVGEENGVWVVYGKNQFACNMLKSQFAAKIDAVRAELVPQQAAFAFKPGVGTHYEMAAQAVAPVQVQEVIEVEECVEPVQMPLQTAAAVEEDRPSETVSKPAAAMTAAEILAQRMKNLPHEPQVQTAAPAESKAVAKAKTDAQHDAEEARYEQTNLRATIHLKLWWKVRATALPPQPPKRLLKIRGRATTRFSYTAVPVWVKPTWCKPLATNC